MSSKATTAGILLEEFVDVSGACGVAYYKGIGYRRERTDFAHAALVFPRGASVVDLEWSSSSSTQASAGKKGAGLQRVRVTTSEMAVLPPGCAHAIIGQSSILDVFIVLPSEAIFAAAASAYGLSPGGFDKMLAAPHVLPRTVWTNELQHRYFYERFVSRQRDNAATTFLEVELAKETYFLSTAPARAPTCAPALFQTNTLGRRAVAYVEAHLFEPTLNVTTIAERVRASRSTLERAFKNEVGRPPNEYIRDRRLDEANALIVADCLPVGQVATLVGYQNFSAFCQAFKRRFEVSPTQVVTRKRSES